MRDRPEPLGIYVHLPFCRQRCAYCDFPVLAGRLDLLPRYLELLSEEISRAGRQLGRPAADTIHFGGGTPSLPPATVIAAMNEGLETAFDLAEPLEVGLEANPEDVDAERLAGWLGAGVTRLTVGVQSLDPEGLEAIGRPGSTGTARRALERARAAGIRSVGADLIFGRPGQTPGEWERELADLVQLDVDHVSCYSLELDSPTPLARAISRGAKPRPDPDDAAEMYELARDALGAAGFERYEISNWAKPGHASRHNLKYWTDRPYLGLGLGAASYVGGQRWTNPRRFRDYEAMVRGGARPAEEPYDRRMRVGEALMFGLRREEGVDLGEIARRHGTEALASRLAALERAERNGLLVRQGTCARLTERGRMIADEVFVDLL